MMHLMRATPRRAGYRLGWRGMIATWLVPGMVCSLGGQTGR
jgi:hypothetical protein